MNPVTEHQNRSDNIISHLTTGGKRKPIRHSSQGRLDLKFYAELVFTESCNKDEN